MYPVAPSAPEKSRLVRSDQISEDSPQSRMQGRWMMTNSKHMYQTGDLIDRRVDNADGRSRRRDFYSLPCKNVTN